MSIPPSNVPVSGPGGMFQHWRTYALAGLLVLLLALPLCLAIAVASGFPPAAGILTAIIGGVVGLLVGGAKLSMKGSAAGLLVLAVGAVEELVRGDAGRGHHLAPATMIVAGALQLIFGLLLAGGLARFIGPVQRGLPLRNMFRVAVAVDSNEDGSYQRLIVHTPLVFSNYRSFKNHLDALPTGQHILIDLSQARLVDRTALKNLHHFQHDYLGTGGRVELIGLPGQRPLAA